MLKHIKKRYIILITVLLGLTSVVLLNLAVYKTDLEQPSSRSTWSDKENEDIMLQIIDGARWAQNAHNVQSWKLIKQVDGSYNIYLDKTRLLPETDPIHRQLIISIGSFVGAAQMTANNLGYEINYNYLPNEQFDIENPEKFPLVNISLSESTSSESSKLIDDINIDVMSSPTVKYKTMGIDFSDEWYLEHEKKWSTELITFKWIREESDVNHLKSFTKEAFKIEMENPPTRDESIEYTQIGNNKRTDMPYGITLLGNFNKSNWWFIETFSTLFPQTAEQYTDTSIKLFNESVDKGQAILSVNSVGNTAFEQLETGRILQLAWMEVYMNKGTLLPLSQGLQEYKKVEDIYVSLHQDYANENETIQMLFMLGTPDGEFYKSPRIQALDIITEK